MYEFWYDYVKPKYGKKAKLCHMDTDSFIVYIKTDGTFKDIVENAETRFDTSNNELDRPLPKKKVLQLKPKQYIIQNANIYMNIPIEY